MPTLLDHHVAHDPDGIALTDESGAVSWSDLGERVNRWMRLFTQRGVDVGDRLACVIGNRREAFEVLLACLHTGVTAVPVNWHLTESEIAHILSDSDSRTVIVEDVYAETVTRAVLTAGTCKDLLVLGERDVEGALAVEPLLAATNGRNTDPGTQTCGCTMLYTSGTTGPPKGVVNGLFVTGAPFKRVEKLCEYARVVLDVPGRDERMLLDGPWYHSSQLFFALLSLLRGAHLLVRGQFDPAATLALIDREQITAAHLVPTQFVRLLRQDEATRGAFSGASLRRVWHGGGPCPVEVKRRMIEWWGPVFLEYYGATEGGAVTLIDSPDWLRRPGSVGRAVPPGEIVVVDDRGERLPPGQAGRVFVRRTRGERFRYHNAEDRTRSAYLTPDTFTFGELGYLDEAGFLYLTGRAQDLIVSGGVNVYPAEVEAVLLTSPAVRDAAVIGVPDEEFGERVAAVVVLEETSESVAEDTASAATTVNATLITTLDAHCRLSLAGFKVPREYRFVAELPREPTGKLRKDVLRDSYDIAAP